MIDSLSMIVPVYNAQSSLGDQIRDLLELLPDLTSRFQVIVVDDGSTDQTLEVAHELGRQFPQILVLGMRERQGHAAAAEAGLRQATGDVVFIQETGRPVRSGDLFRLWQLRGDHHLPTTASQPLPLDAGLIQRLTRWGRSLCDLPAESRPTGTLHMLRRSEVRDLRGPDSRPSAGRNPATGNPAPGDPNRARPVSRRAATDRVAAPMATSPPAPIALRETPPEDPHQLLDWSVKALYS